MLALIDINLISICFGALLAIFSASITSYLAHRRDRKIRLETVFEREALMVALRWSARLATTMQGPGLSDTQTQQTIADEYFQFSSCLEYSISRKTVASAKSARRLATKAEEVFRLYSDLILNGDAQRAKALKVLQESLVDFKKMLYDVISAV